MPIPRNQPSPQRQSVLSFATADVADFLFYETVDAQRFGKGSDDLEATLPKYGTPHPDSNKFPNHKLCYVKPADPTGLTYQFFYVADRSAQENNHNWEYRQADLGGNKYDTVVRTYVTPRADFKDTDANYKAGSDMPNSEGGTTNNIPNWNNEDVTGANQFNAEDVLTHDGAIALGVDETRVSTGYKLYTRQQKKIGDRELDGLFVVEQRVYFRRVDIVTQKLDPATDGVLKSIVKLIARDETFTTNGSTRTAGTQGWMDKTNWGLSSDGQNIECRQLSHDWWQINIQDIIPQTAVTNSDYGGQTIRTYDTYQNYRWPSVVGSLFFNTANKKDGSSSNTVIVRNKEGKDGFSGQTKMTVTQVWKKDKFTSLPAPVVFKTVSAVYNGVQFNVRVSNVLTEAITLTDFIGSEDPVYRLGDYANPKPWCPASTPTDWPTANPFIGSVSQKPFRGGYLLEIVQIHHPA